MNIIFNNLSSKLYFRKFTRKKFAAFNSLGKLIKISTLGVACSLIYSPLQGQTDSSTDTIAKSLDLEEVEVVGQKTTVLIENVPRMVEMIGIQTIQSAPSHSFQDLIQYGSNIDVQQRGQYGIQADISIRGGSFDQVLVLLNGANLSDPQTGHHSLNLPIDLESISRIEILNGPAARAIGANAFSGAINVITTPLDTNLITLSTHTGQFGFNNIHGSVNFKLKNSSHLLTSSYAQSDGYIENTDFKAYNLYYHGKFKLSSSNSAFLQFGTNDKAFGANSFYTPKYPDQFENTQSFYFHAGLKTGSRIQFKPSVYWRRHYDRFELFRESKDYYSKTSDDYYVSETDTAGYLISGVFYPYSGHNYHLTDIIGSSFNLTVRNAFGKTTLGTNLKYEGILSNSLGEDLTIPLLIEGTDSVFYTKHASRANFDLFLEHVYTNKHWFISGGTMVHWNSFLPNEINFFPGVDISYSLSNRMKLLTSYNYTLGLPSFTDLNYQGPTNEGNATLRPYYQHSIEGGAKITVSDIQLKTIAFYTHGKNNIEWVLNNETNRFSPINTDLSENLGIEASLNYTNSSSSIFNRLVSHVYLGYTYIDTYRASEDTTSKYTNIKHKFTAQIQQNISKQLVLSWNIMYKQRIGNYIGYDFDNDAYTLTSYPDVFLVDARLSYSIKSFTLYGEISNILDNEYIETGSISQPGRWIKGGLKYKFGW